MLFKALSVYRLQADLSFTKETLEEALGAHKFVPCSALQTESFGWVSPYDDDRMVASVSGQHLIVLQVEKKKVPAALVKQKLAIRVAEIEDTEGRQVSRKEKKELKEAILFDGNGIGLDPEDLKDRSRVRQNLGHAIGQGLD